MRLYVLGAGEGAETKLMSFGEVKDMADSGCWGASSMKGNKAKRGRKLHRTEHVKSGAAPYGDKIQRVHKHQDSRPRPKGGRSKVSPFGVWWYPTGLFAARARARTCLLVDAPHAGIEGLA